MNIDRYRPLVSLLLIVVLLGTNLSYLMAYSSGAVTAYSAKWDTPQIRLLNLFLLALIVALAVIKPKTPEDEG